MYILCIREIAVEVTRIYFHNNVFIISSYIPRDSSMNSETYHYKKGANQLFSQTSHIFDPTLYTEEDLIYNADREVFTTLYIFLSLKLVYFFHIKIKYIF